MNVLLVKYGEIALRGKNRGIFENMLISSISKSLKKYGEYKIVKDQGRFVVFDAGAREASEIAKVFGVTGVSVAIKLDDQSLPSIKKAAVDCLVERFGDAPFTFKVETKRADKRYPMTSPEISASVRTTSAVAVCFTEALSPTCNERIFSIRSMLFPPEQSPLFIW